MIICHLALLLMRALYNMYDEPIIVFTPRRYGGRPLVKYREPKKAENFGILPIFSILEKMGFPFEFLWPW